MTTEIEVASEASLFPKKGRVIEESSTLQVHLTGYDLAILKKLGGSPRNALEEAITAYITNNGKHDCEANAHQARLDRQAKARDC